MLLVFSAHTTASQDNELKRLWRILEGEVSVRQKSHLKKQIETKRERENKALALEKKLVSLIENEHKMNPFIGALGEFSKEKKERYLLRIEVASFVRKRLYETIDISKEKIDDFILLLTGEDVYPFLEGNFLAHVSLIPSEDHDLQVEIGSRIGMCKGMLGTLGLGRSDLSQYASTLLEPFYRPHPKDFPSYLEKREELVKLFSENGLLRLRVGIPGVEDVESAVSNCDALFDTRRDDFTVEVMKSLPSGNYLLTRGIAHRHLMKLP
ncbi:MAG: hypothetical protein NXH75_07285 [Halobacteriovoraceae bacterium]|nr:hypothetical protein [Halobacteriovoraceae bacterium]